jgi:hypothetical protein
MAETIGWLFIIGWIALIIHCPILKPWFGFRKPHGHQGHWFE